MCKWSKFGGTRNYFFYRSLPFLIAFKFLVCHAVLVNRTIDSNIGDPVTGFMPIYQPQDLWINQTCPHCFIQPDTSKAFDGTWEATLYSPGLPNVNITLQFTGIAIWVFFILANVYLNSAYYTTTQVNITLDSQYAGNFSHDPDMTTHDLWYNQTIFSTTGLTNTSHKLVIGTNDYPFTTFLNFDWAVYTVDIPAPPNTPSSSTSNALSSSSSIGVIVGCTLGGLVVIVLLLFFLDRRRRQKRGPEGNNLTPHQSSYGEPQARQSGLSAPLGSEYTHFQPSSYATPFPVPIYGQERSYTTRLQEARQTEIDNRIQYSQHEAASFKPVRNVRSVGGPSSAVPSHVAREIASLRNEVQQLRDRMEAQRGPQSLSNEPLPPAYTVE